jgi:hypothetical protein
VQTVRGRWFLSRPVLAAGVLYALLTSGAAALELWIAAAPALLPLPATARFSLMAAAALAVGLCLGMIRERSLSLWSGAAALAAGGILRLAVELWPPGR